MRKQITAPTYNDDRTERYENEPVTILFDVDEYKDLSLRAGSCRVIALCFR